MHLWILSKFSRKISPSLLAEIASLSMSKTRHKAPQTMKRKRLWPMTPHNLIKLNKLKTFPKFPSRASRPFQTLSRVLSQQVKWRTVSASSSHVKGRTFVNTVHKRTGKSKSFKYDWIKQTQLTRNWKARLKIRYRHTHPDLIRRDKWIEQSWWRGGIYCFLMFSIMSWAKSRRKRWPHYISNAPVKKV